MLKKAFKRWVVAATRTWTTPVSSPDYWEVWPARREAFSALFDLLDTLPEDEQQVWHEKIDVVQNSFH